MTTRTRQTSRVQGSPTRARSRPTHRTPRSIPTRSRLNNAGLFLVVALTIATIGLLYLIQTSTVAGLGYEVSRLERERLEKSLENQQLTYELARRESLPEIERIAREELEMEAIDNPLYLTVPRPVVDDLPIPNAPPSHRRSLVERVWDRLTGEAEASHPGSIERAGP